jgi:acetyl esterase/lipase
MASIEAHLLDLLVRVQFKSRMNRNTDLASIRRTLQGDGLPAPRLPSGVTFTSATVGGTPGEWVRAGELATPTLLYLHGGGYFACSPRTHRPITAAYARRGFAVFVPDYRLAPEHPYPAAIEDAEAAFRGLLDQGHPAQSLTVSGDSAGGGLALALMLSLRDKHLALPAAAALFSPWTDLAGSGRSVVTNARRDAMFRAARLVEAGAYYLGTAPATDPLASPHYASLAGLPPLLIHAGDREILRDDSIRLAEHARAAGVETDLRIWPVVPHVWQMVPFVPEARESLDLAAAFLKRHAVLPNADGGGP